MPKQKKKGGSRKTTVHEYESKSDQVGFTYGGHSADPTKDMIPVSTKIQVNTRRGIIMDYPWFLRSVKPGFLKDGTVFQLVGARCVTGRVFLSPVGAVTQPFALQKGDSVVGNLGLGFGIRSQGQYNLIIQVTVWNRSLFPCHIFGTDPRLTRPHAPLEAWLRVHKIVVASDKSAGWSFSYVPTSRTTTFVCALELTLHTPEAARTTDMSALDMVLPTQQSPKSGQEPRMLESGGGSWSIVTPGPARVHIRMKSIKGHVMYGSPVLERVTVIKLM